MRFPELFTALRQGAVDGQENPILVILSSKFSQVQKYLSLGLRNLLYGNGATQVDTGVGTSATPSAASSSTQPFVAPSVGPDAK